MKFTTKNTKFAAILSLIAAAQAAPIVKTITHTAPTVTVWLTYTTGTTWVSEHQTTVSSEPPTTDAATTAATTSAADEQSSEATTSAAEATSDSAATTAAVYTLATADTTSTSSTEQASTSSTEQASTTSSTASATTSDTTSSLSASSTSTPTSDFEVDILNEHNVKRALHGVPALTWDSTLADYAAEYAASSFSCDNVELVHSGGDYGENLAAGYSGGIAPVDAWYDEISDYDFSNPGYSESTGHFTQVVWKSTSKLGCAKVDCDNAWKQYTICEYSDTVGNIIGTDSSTGIDYFVENVLELI